MRLIAYKLKELVKAPFYALYEKRVVREVRQWDPPNHIGIILDGNRRYAREAGLPTIIDGHALGADKLHEVLDWCFEYGIKVVTIWIFSVDNFNREADEVDQLLNLIDARSREMIHSEDVHRNRVRIRYLGRTDLLPQSLQDTISEVEQATAAYEGFALNVAIAYGGREEITDAMKRLIEKRLADGTPVEEILSELEPDALAPFLYTQGLPDPDLIIRTSGEVRLSGFLLWQSAYSEFYFCDTYWPQFRRIDFLRAIRSYQQRSRRFGR